MITCRMVYEVLEKKIMRMQITENNVWMITFKGEFKIDIG